MDAINKLVDVIIKQNEFILKLMNDDRVTQEIKLEYAEKYNKLMINMSEILQQNK